MKTELPHEKSADKITDIALNVFIFSVMFLFIVMLSFIMHFICIPFTDNEYVTASIILGLWYIYIPYNYSHYHHFNISNNVHAIEKEQNKGKTSGTWLYIYYVVYGQLWNTTRWFYTRCVVSSVIVASVSIITRLYDIHSPSQSTTGVVVVAGILFVYLLVTWLLNDPDIKDDE